jgi:signal transduction histidine kinase
VAELESIFEPFKQSSRTRDGSGGTGLGLSITRKIMAAHGGSVEAGNATGGGAVMRMRLPAAQSLPAAGRPCAEADAA